jgi:hypothetical protein
MVMLDFKNWFGGFLNINTRNWLTSFLSGYGRTRMEPVYDWVAQTPIFQELRKKPDALKYLIEASNNALFSFLDQKIDEKSQLRKLFKEIVMDGSSELNKRLINGEPVKSLLAENVGRISDSREQDFLAVLLTMDEKRLAPFLEQLIMMTVEERTDLAKKMKGLTMENMTRLAGLPPETRAMILEVSQEPESKKKTDVFKSMHKDLNSFLDERLERKRRERDARRNAKKNSG